MTDSFGLKIGLEGEKEFKESLSEINQSFKVLGSEMKLAASQFEKNDTSVQALTARNTVLNKEIEAQKQKIEALGNIDNETERNALAMTLLGKSAQELNPLIEAGADRMHELGEEAHAAGDVLSDEMLQYLFTLTFTMISTRLLFRDTTREQKQTGRVHC